MASFDQSQIVSTSVTLQKYSTVSFVKSSASSQFSRSFNKVDYLIAYLGGQFGSFLGILFLIKIYTQVSFEVMLGCRMYLLEVGNKVVKGNSFGLFKFLGYSLYSFFNKLGCSISCCEGMRAFDECRKEVKKQFDVKLLIDRITFMERALKNIYSDHQFKALHLQKKMTISEARDMRELYSLKRIIK